MKIAIMQPYFFPYIGYFQLINAADVFVVYDDIQYVKQSWINRNRILVNSAPSYISLPLKKDSDYLFVKQRNLADSWDRDRKKFLQRLSGSYRKAPNFESTFELLANGLEYKDRNLYNFLFMNLKLVLSALNIKTTVVTSSSLGDFTHLQSQDKVISICDTLNADEYVNPIGGLELYDKSQFLEKGIALHFMKSKVVPYKQLGGDFVPFLSIIDVMMFNDSAEICAMLTEFERL